MMGACSSGSSIEDDLRAAEMALANGDMRAAESATQHVVGSENFSGLTSKQLARLSLIYIAIGVRMRLTGIRLLISFPLLNPTKYHTPCCCVHCRSRVTLFGAVKMIFSRLILWSLTP